MDLIFAAHAITSGWRNGGQHAKFEYPTSLELYCNVESYTIRIPATAPTAGPLAVILKDRQEL